MKRIEVEVKEEDAKLIKTKLGLDVQVLVQELTKGLIKGLKELYLARQAGVSISQEEATKLGYEAGMNALKKAEEAAEGEESSSD